MCLECFWRQNRRCQSSRSKQGGGARGWNQQVASGSGQSVDGHGTRQGTHDWTPGLWSCLFPSVPSPFSTCLVAGTSQTEAGRTVRGRRDTPVFCTGASRRRCDCHSSSPRESSCGRPCTHAAFCWRHQAGSCFPGSSGVKFPGLRKPRCAGPVWTHGLGPKWPPETGVARHTENEDRNDTPPALKPLTCRPLRSVLL